MKKTHLKTTSNLLLDGVQACTCDDLVTAFALIFATYYIYTLSYPDEIQSTITSFQAAFEKIAQIAKYSNDK